MKKVCSKCAEEKELKEFSKHSKGKFGKHPQCNVCRSTNYKTYYQTNATSILARQKRREKYNPSYERFKKYGLLAEDYKKMLLEQNNSCKICKTETKLVVDHCHTTNKVRGLLCNKCNRGLGCFLDNTKNLLQAINYLRKG